MEKTNRVEKIRYCAERWRSTFTNTKIWKRLLVWSKILDKRGGLPSKRLNLRGYGGFRNWDFEFWKRVVKMLRCVKLRDEVNNWGFLSLSFSAFPNKGMLCPFAEKKAR